MYKKILEIVRSRSREQWQRHFMERWVEVRGWIQDNGELAAVVSLFCGILLVLLFRVVLFLIAVGVIAAFVFWQLALPSEDRGVETTDRPDPGTSSENDPREP